MDYEDYLMRQEEQNKGEDDAKEEECGLCAAAPCRCDAIYDAWRDEQIFI